MDDTLDEEFPRIQISGQVFEFLNNFKAVLRPRRSATKRATVKKNPLKNIKAMLKLNPYAAVHKRAAQKAIAANTKKQ